MHPPGHIFLIIFVLDIPAVSILEYPNQMKFSIWDKFKRCKKLEVNWHYLNPILIFKDFIPIPSGQIPVPVTPIPFSQPKNRPIPAPILPLYDPKRADIRIFVCTQHKNNRFQRNQLCRTRIYEYQPSLQKSSLLYRPEDYTPMV